MTKRGGSTSEHLRRQAAAEPQDELAAGLSGQPASIQARALLAQLLDRANLQRALKQVRQNQGAPLSPVLANVVLDELDWELERRGHRFARYADDCDALVKSKRAGVRVMASVTRSVSDSLRLTVNALKSVVDRPMNRKFLGFPVSRDGAKLKVADKVIEKLKHQVRELTRRTRGTSLGAVVAEL
jgi:hypothetical protein